MARSSVAVALVMIALVVASGALLLGLRPLVSSINNLTGDFTFTTSSPITMSTVGNIITYACPTCLTSGGSGFVSSVSNSDGTLTISPTVGAVVASLNLAAANTWSAITTFSKQIQFIGSTIPVANQFGIGTDGTNLVLNSKSGGGVLSMVNGVNQENILATGIQMIQKIILYNNINTVGWGVPAIYAEGGTTGATATFAGFDAYTPTAEGHFILGCTVIVNSVSGGSVAVTVAYTDRGGTSRTETILFDQSTPTLLTTLTVGGSYSGLEMEITSQANKQISFTATATATINYDVLCHLAQVG